MGIDGDIERVVVVGCNVEHARADIFRPEHRFRREHSEDELRVFLLQFAKAVHEGSRGGDVEVVSEAGGALAEPFDPALDGRLVPPEQGLVRQASGNLLRDRRVG